jgi:hypothetical protein
MPVFTREQLRNFTTNSVDFTSTSYTFNLDNNASTTAGFAIEGVNKDIFNSASISNLIGCTVVSGSANAAFIIEPNTSARFDFTPTSTISKDLIKFSAPNVLIYNTNDLTASGSVIGTDLNLTEGCTAPTWTGDICLSYINSKGNPDQSTYRYDSNTFYNGQPIWILPGLPSVYTIRWEGSMWELVYTPTGAKSTGGPSNLCSPVGVYTGSQIGAVVSPATAVEGACPP